MATQPLSLSRTVISQLQMITHHVEEKIIIEQVKDTHNPNGGIDIDANCLLKLMEDIFNFNTVPREAMQNKLQLHEHIQKEIPFVALQLSFMVAFTCVSNDDSHSTTIYLLCLLSKYMWHVKGVMLLACFAIIRGRFKVASLLCHRKGLTYNMIGLRKSLNSMLSSENENFLNDSIKSMFDLTKLMVELRHSPSMFLVNYWITRSVVACARLLILDLEPQNQIITELSNVSTKVKAILASSLPLLEARREAKIAEENYQALLHAFDNSSDILEVLKLIFNVKNEEHQRYSRSTVLDAFQGEGVLLLISSGKHFPYYAYKAPRGVGMIWVPIINDVDEHIQIPADNYYYNHVLDPLNSITPEFLRFLKQVFPTFQVGGDPIAISLDKRGRLVHYNALHMILIWGSQLYDDVRTSRSAGYYTFIPSLENELRERTSGANRVIDDIDKQIHNLASKIRRKINDWVDDVKAKMKSSFRSYIYTHENEQVLWDKESWNLKLVIGWSQYYWDFQWILDRWIEGEYYIFLCGGNNKKRVLEFLIKVHKIRSKFQMNMKIVDIGRRRTMTEEASNSFDSKRFWARLDSVASSRIQYLNKIGRVEGSDEILQGLRKLLAYEDECTTIGAWALLSKGRRIIACDMGDKMLGVLNEYEKMKENALITNDFDKAFEDYYEMLINRSSHSSHQDHCCALNYSSNLVKIPEIMSCPQCNHNMHKFVAFSCCHGPTNYSKRD